MLGTVTGITFFSSTFYQIVTTEQWSMGFFPTLACPSIPVRLFFFFLRYLTWFFPPGTSFRFDNFIRPRATLALIRRPASARYPKGFTCWRVPATTVFTTSATSTAPQFKGRLWIVALRPRPVSTEVRIKKPCFSSPQNEKKLKKYSHVVQYRNFFLCRFLQHNLVYFCCTHLMCTLWPYTKNSKELPTA